MVTVPSPPASALLMKMDFPSSLGPVLPECICGWPSLLGSLSVNLKKQGPDLTHQLSPSPFQMTWGKGARGHFLRPGTVPAP